MDQVTITITTGNAAFGTEEFEQNAEIARILRKLADKFEQGDQPEFPVDANGNRVGRVEYE